MTDDIVSRLNITADMIGLGDKIRYGSDSAIMREAADEIEKLRAALKPFALNEHQIERWYGMDVADSHSVVSSWVTVGDLRAAKAALGESDD